VGASWNLAHARSPWQIPSRGQAFQPSQEVLADTWTMTSLEDYGGGIEDLLTGLHAATGNHNHGNNHHTRHNKANACACAENIEHRH
jgi:hypothetical protein